MDCLSRSPEARDEKQLGPDSLLLNGNALVTPAQIGSHTSGHQPSLERRSKIRFPLKLGVHYRTMGDLKCSFSGFGHVANISSSGVLVAFKHEMRPGVKVELVIEWPPLLHGRIRLHLVIVGKVLRCQTSHLAVVQGAHGFRTRRTRAWLTTGQTSGGCLS
jgi:hypothetical protein